MAVDYRFLGSNVDVLFVTDATLGNKMFFVTEKRGEDPADIMAGIDVEIQEYHEADFIQIAMDKSVDLFRIDRMGEVCLVRIGAPAGVFNGTSSILQVDDVTLATSGVINYPLSFKFTFRMSEAQILQPMGRRITFMGTDTSVRSYIIIATSYPPFTSVEPAGIPINITFDWVPLYNPFSAEMTLIPDMCNEIEFRIAIEGNRVLGQAFHNGNEVGNSDLASTTVRSAIDDYDMTYGAANRGDVNRDFFPGVMRNLVVTSSAGELVNIIDPSDGTNTGSEADGVPTDVSAITIIV